MYTVYILKKIKNIQYCIHTVNSIDNFVLNINLYIYICLYVFLFFSLNLVSSHLKRIYNSNLFFILKYNKNYTKVIGYY